MSAEHSSGHTTPSHGHANHDAHGTVFQRIWIPFFILLGITAVEFAIALMPVFHSIPKMTKSIIFLALTVVKAGYIIGYFMHLKFEKFSLMLSLGVPVLFVVYLIILLLIEGNYIHFMIEKFG